MSEMMRAVDIKNGAGSADALFINNETSKPTATGAQALVKVKAFGLNRMDLMQREGKYPLPPQAPKTMGVEFSGTIESLGDEAEKSFKVGDAVFGLAYGGAYAEYISVSSHMLVHKPKELSWEQCAGIPETWITAIQAMYLVGGYTPGKSILWHAGASSVSISGIQLAVADSAKAVYSTARRDDKCKFTVNELGATAAFNTETSNWSEEVVKATNGAGVDIIIDFVGAPYFQGNLTAAARDATIVMLAGMGGFSVENANLAPMLFKRIRLEGSTLRSRDEAYQKKLRDQLVEHALPGLVSGKFNVPISKVFKFEEIAEAHRLMETNNTMGKIVVVIE